MASPVSDADTSAAELGNRPRMASELHTDACMPTSIGSELDLSVVVPAYNEEKRLEAPLRHMLSELRRRRGRWEVIVVDDGSRDGTSALVLSIAAAYDELRLIRLPENRGKGYAVRTGIVNARGKQVLFADADGATPIAELERLELALANGADVAIGSRALARHEVNVAARLHRRLIGRIFHFAVSTLAVRGFQDTQCGFKLFRRAAAQDLFSHMRIPGFSFDVEVLVMAQRRGYRVAEVPVNWEHQPGSKVNLVLDSLRMLRDLFIIRSHALRGRYERPQVTPLVAPPASSQFELEAGVPASSRST
jgi:dolichyl-phosphate beta-glucosyltransferase